MSAQHRPILVTGAAGRVGGAVWARLQALGDDPRGLDRNPGPAVRWLADIGDDTMLRRACEGVGAVVHTAALHAPHVGHVQDAEFVRVNIDATRRLLDAAARAGVPRFVFTSTTALYGDASLAPGRAAWVDEALTPIPRTIYHRTKLAAEALLREAAEQGGPSLRILRMSRCFPEPANAMAVLRLHRGIDVRDVADAHARAVMHDGPMHAIFVVSGRTPFLPEDLEELAHDAPAAIARRAPGLIAAFAARGWSLPSTIDRVYCAHAAVAALGWTPLHGWEEVLAQFDAGSSELLPPAGHHMIDGDLRE